MKRLFLTLVFMCSLLSLSAQTTAREWLEKLDSSLGERYAMQLYVTVGDVDNVGDQYGGFFMVEGDAYYINLGVMEVYSDGKLRYEVNNERKEVTEDSVNLEAVDLLSNPTRAFDFVDEEYTITIARSSGNGVTLCLEPKSGDIGISSILLQLEKTGNGVTPKEITYNYEGDVINISLTSADMSSGAMPRWNRSEYRAYDIVSFL